MKRTFVRRWLKHLAISMAAVATLIAVAIAGLWWWIDKPSFAAFVKPRIETMLAGHLDRKVTIGAIAITRGTPYRVTIRDFRIGSFAAFGEIDATVRIESVRQRRIRIDRIDVRDPRVNVEIRPQNVPQWKSSGGADVVFVSIGTIAIERGAVNFVDHQDGVVATAAGIDARMDMQSQPSIIDATLVVPKLTMRVKDGAPLDVQVRTAIRYSEDVVAVRSFDVTGSNVATTVSGTVRTKEPSYDFRLRAGFALDRISALLKLAPPLDGRMAIDAKIRGRKDKFDITGKWSAPRLAASGQEVTNARGHMTVTDHGVSVDVDAATYAGGSIGGRYALKAFSEPYPMSAALTFDRILVERLFSGARGVASGSAKYAWNGSRVLEGSGDASASVREGTVFTTGKHPLPVEAAADVVVERGNATIRSASFTTPASSANVTGSVRLPSRNGDLKAEIHSRDLTEFDRTATNISGYEALGLGGSGSVTINAKGTLDRPVVTATATTKAMKFKSVELGDADAAIRYDATNALTIDTATLSAPEGRVHAAGRVTPAGADIAIDADGYPLSRVLQAAGLPATSVRALTYGRIEAHGKQITLNDFRITRDASVLRASGTIDLTNEPCLNLDVISRAFPLASVVPNATGALTGTMRVNGSLHDLSGGGAITVEDATVDSEPIDLATVDLKLAGGRIEARNIAVTARAGQIEGDAEADLASKSFRYDLRADAIVIDRIQHIANHASGKLTFESKGSGTLDQPVITAKANLEDAVVAGMAIPSPRLELAINGRDIQATGSLGDVLTSDAKAHVATDLGIDGSVHIAVPDLTKVSAPLPLSGHAAVDVQIGGALTSVDQLNVVAKIVDFDVKVADRALTFARPLQLALREGTLFVDDFELQQPNGSLVVSGSAQLRGAKKLDLRARGALDAAVAELLVPELSARGNLAAEVTIGGTADEPDLEGSIAIEDGHLRMPQLPQSIDAINGTIAFTRERITIRDLAATIGDGTIKGSGDVILAGWKLSSLNFGLKAANVTLRTLEGLIIGGDADLDLRGNSDRMVLRGKVNITKGLYARDLDIATAILNLVLSPSKPATATVAAGWKDRMRFDVAIAANSTLAIRNNLADLTGKADLRLGGSLAHPSITGLVTLDEGGRVRLQNVDYHVVNGSINFQNPFRIDPYFDITLEGRLASSPSADFNNSGGPVDVTINLSGTVDRFTPTISTNPPTNDVTLFSLIGLASVDTSNRSGSSGSGSAIPVGLVTQSLVAHSMLNKVPLAGSLSYDPGLVDQVEDPGPKVTFQRVFQNKFRVIIVYNLERSHTRSRLEWQVNPEWSLQITRDEVRQEYRLEALTRRRYEAHWGGAERGEESAGNETEATLRAASGCAQCSSSESGATVSAVSYRADASFDTSVLTSAISIAPGRPLSMRAVQKSIKDLFATGEFRDVRVETAPSSDGGVSVTFVLSLHHRLSRIEVEGLPKKQLEGGRREVAVRVDDVASLAAIDASAVAMQRYLHNNGYLEALVDPEVTYRPSSRTAVVIFRVDARSPAHVGAVAIDGEFAPFKRDDLLAEMKLATGKPFKRATAREDATRMQHDMAKAGYRKADVRYAGDTYDPNTHTVALHYTATSGPKVRIVVTGVPEKSVRDAIKAAGNQPWSEDVADETAQAMVAIYQRRGHYQAKAEAKTQQEPDGTLVTTFTVQPGPEFRLDSVTFSGNARMPEDKLKDVIFAKPQRGIHGWFARMFHRAGITQEQINQDRTAIEAHYQIDGFSEVKVSPPEVRVDGEKKTIAIAHHIIEGPQTRVASVRIEGNKEFPSTSLPKLRVVAGEPLNPERLNKDVLALQSYYAERGYATAKATVRPEISADKTSAAVTYTIDEGSKSSIGRVTVRGNTFTQSDVVLQQAAIKPGQPFSYKSLLEAQRNLFRLGTFSKAEVQADTISGDKQNVVVQVDEGKDLTVSGSIGVTQQSENPTSLLGTISFLHSNLAGTGRALGLTIVGGYPNRDRQEAFLTYREPFVGSYNIPVTFNIFKSEEVRPGAHIVKNGTSVETTKPLSTRTRWSLRYEYLNSICTDGDLCAAGDEALIPGYDKDFSDELTSAITPTIFWDGRDDPIDPHRGMFTSLSVQYAFPLFAANTHYLKEYGTLSFYYPVSRDTVFAVASRIGFIQGIGSTASPDCDATQSCVPLTQRFTGGGESSHRAYALDLLGDLCDPADTKCQPTLVDVDGTISPVGGQSIFIASLEYRFPIAGSVGAAVFTDVGNVFADKTIRLDSVHWGAGAGLRYLSPVGPLRFDIGYKIHRKSYETPFAYFLTFGYAF